MFIGIGSGIFCAILFFLLICTCLLMNTLAKNIFMRQKFAFDKLLREQASASQIEMLEYNFKRDRFINTSENLSEYDNLNLLQFITLFKDGNAIIDLFNKMRKPNIKILKPIICSRTDNNKHIILYVTPIPSILNIGKTRKLAIVLCEKEAEKKKFKELSVNDFRSIFDAVSTGLLLCSGDGTIIDINQSACQIYGIPDKDALLARQLNIFNNPHYKGPRSNEEFNNNGALFVYNIDFDNLGNFVSGRTGKAVLATRYYKLEDSESHIVVVVTDLTDETYSKNIYTELFNEQQTILQVSPIGYAIFTPNGILSYANKAYFDILGISNTKGYIKEGHSLFKSDLLPDSFKNDLKDNNIAEAEGQLEFTDDFRQKISSNKKGTIDVVVRCQRVTDIDGAKGSYVLCVSDVTKSESRYRKIVELDKERNMFMQMGGITAWTRNFTTGQRENIIGADTNNFPDLNSDAAIKEKYHPDDQKEFRTAFNAFKTGILKEARNIFRIKNSNVEGGYAYFEFTARRTDTPDKVGVVVRDVTTQSIYNRMLEQSKTRAKLTIQDTDLVQFDIDIENEKITIYNHSDVFKPMQNCFLSDFLSLVHPDNMDTMMELTTRFRTREDFNCTTYYKTKFHTEDQAWHNVQMYTTPLVRDSNGKVLVYTGLMRDNTKWIKATEVIEENNALINAFINSIPCMFSMKDVDNESRYVMANDYACQLGSKSRFEIIGYTDKEAFGSIQYLDTQIETSNDDIAIRNGSAEYNIDLTINGKTSSWHATKKLIKTNNGHRYILSAAIDVTQLFEYIKKLNQANKLLEKNTFLLNTFIDAVPCLFWMKDIDNGMRYIMANDQACQMAGLSQNEIIGHTDEELFNSDERFDIKREIDTDTQAIANGHIEYIGDLQVNGERKVWNTIKQCITAQDGHRYLIVVLSDVTELQNNIDKLEAAVKESDRLNQLQYIIINSLPCLFSMKDMNDDLKYCLANDKYCENIGIDRNYILGHTDKQIFAPNVSAYIESKDKVAIDFGSYDYDEKSIWKNDSDQTMWHTQKKVLDIMGNKYLVVTSLDITQLYAALNELKVAKSKAEQADQLKTMFLANMSHEIRTPLNAICGFSELLINTNDPQLREQYYGYVSSNTEILLTIINDILDISKLEAGYMNFKYEKFDLSEVCNNLYKSFQKRATKQVEITFDNPYESCIVEFDKSRLSQIINNYMSNAIKYTPSGSITLTYHKEGDGIHIQVSDTGIGISEENHHRVFKRFEKINTFMQGTGLGLSICKLIAEDVGGNVGFESEQNVGSTFWAWLPMTATINDNTKQHDSITAPELTEPQEINATNEILVAEDNDSNFLLLKAILKNFKLERAVNGLEAVDKMKSKKFSLVIMDMKMPIMDGLEATSKIRQFNTETPILALTANSFDSDRDAALKAGCSAFMPKPINQKDLFEIMSKLLPSTKN